MHILFLLFLVWMLFSSSRVSRASDNYVEACELSPMIDLAQDHGIDAVPREYRRRVRKILARHDMAFKDGKIVKRTITRRVETVSVICIIIGVAIASQLPSLKGPMPSLQTTQSVAPTTPTLPPLTAAAVKKLPPLAYPENRAKDESAEAYSARVDAYVAEKARRNNAR